MGSSPEVVRARWDLVDQHHTSRLTKGRFEIAERGTPGRRATPEAFPPCPGGMAGHTPKWVAHLSDQHARVRNDERWNRALSTRPGSGTRSD